MSINESLNPKEMFRYVTLQQSFETSSTDNPLIAAQPQTMASVSGGPGSTTSVTPTNTAADQSMLPSWSYATKKTVAKGALNASMLMSNATALKAYYHIGHSERGGLWTANVSLLVASIILQTLVSVGIGLLAAVTPKTPKHHNYVNLLNNGVVILVIVISIINIVISGIGLDVIDSTGGSH